MTTKQGGMMFILSSPSGVGKTTLTKKSQVIIKIFLYQFLTQQEYQELVK